MTRLLFNVDFINANTALNGLKMTPSLKARFKLVLILFIFYWEYKALNSLEVFLKKFIKLSKMYKAYDFDKFLTSAEFSLI
jgi:hypothetical protein